VTSDLAKRVGQHKGDLVDGLTHRHRVHPRLARVAFLYGFGHSSREGDQEVEAKTETWPG
jgi:predicted GIY-YIG superfamily endonuclease